MRVGERIRQRREELGLSVKDVATALCLHRSTIYRYESNEIEKFPTDALEPLAKVLHTSPAYLMGWTNDPIDYDDESLLEDIRTDLLRDWQEEGLTQPQIARRWVAFQRAEKLDAQLAGDGSKQAIETNVNPEELVPVIFASSTLTRGFPMYFVLEESKLLILKDTDGVYADAKYAVMVEFTDIENGRFIRGDVLLFDSSDHLESGELGLGSVTNKFDNGCSEEHYWFIQDYGVGYLPVGVKQSEIEKREHMSKMASGETYVSITGKFIGVLDKSKILKGTLDY